MLSMRLRLVKGLAEEKVRAHCYTLVAEDSPALIPPMGHAELELWDAIDRLFQVRRLLLRLVEIRRLLRR